MDNLLGVCGLTESTCGESMFSKVTNLFGANTTDASDDVDCEDEQHDRTTSTNEANGKSEEIDATNQKPMGSSPASPKQSPIEVDGLPATPALPNSPQRPKSPKSSDSQPLEEKVQEGGKLKNIIKKRSNWFTRKGKEKDDSPNVAHTVSPFGSEKSVENEEDNDDGDDGDDEDVHALLANLEIPDFDMSLEHDDDDKVGSLPGGQKPWEVVDWKERINREEVFSKLYKPKRSEVQELYAMSNTLGVAKSTGILRSIGMVSKGTQDIQTLLSGEHSILMANFRVMHGEVAYHMLLFNDGFILKNQSVNYFNPLEKRYEACHLWNDVDFVERVNASEITVQIVDGTKTYELSSADEEVSLETIFKCLERIIISNEIFDGTSNRKETLGWQYLRVRKPAFTAAVMNDPTILDGKHEIMAESINDLDEYNQHAPLHYAVLHEECNLDVIRRLLKAGAKPNLEDGEGRNAMYYGMYLQVFVRCVDCRKLTHTFSRS